MNDHGSFRLKLTRLLRHETAVNKIQIRGGVATAMQPDPHWNLLFTDLQSFRHLNAVGLWRVIDV